MPQTLYCGYVVVVYTEVKTVVMLVVRVITAVVQLQDGAKVTVLAVVVLSCLEGGGSLCGGSLE